jgi:HTH-type transcriptional regulator / antitoxin HipB
MSDLKQYIKKRKTADKRFAKNYDLGYEDFKVGVILRSLREEAGLTQEELAHKLHTQKSAVSRIETKAEDIRISTLFKLAAVLGKQVHITID